MYGWCFGLKLTRKRGVIESSLNFMDFDLNSILSPLSVLCTGSRGCSGFLSGSSGFLGRFSGSTPVAAGLRSVELGPWYPEELMAEISHVPPSPGYLMFSEG